jgi:oligopeptide/dipeptide ABC transporter ATP-binding protein
MSTWEAPARLDPGAGSLLAARGLDVHFGDRGGRLVRAVDGVDVDVREGEILALVGESGCGKTTLGRTLLGQQRETGGTIQLRGRMVSGLSPREARQRRQEIQYVHQDPGAALDPWWTVGATLHESLLIAGIRDRAERSRRIDEMLDAVGLDPALQNRYPHEFSGGQQRRIGLARTLVLRPSIVILDEPTSGLDLSVQATVLRLFLDMKARFGLTYVFISHDLAVVRMMCDRVMVMYLGRVVEQATAQALFAGCAHPYSRALLGASPRLDPDARLTAQIIDGDPPSAAAIPEGCRFGPRCAIADAACRRTDPKLARYAAGSDHEVACLKAAV